jgi:hypothetical protein
MRRSALGWFRRLDLDTARAATAGRGRGLRRNGLDRRGFDHDRLRQLDLDRGRRYGNVLGNRLMIAAGLTIAAIARAVVEVAGARAIVGVLPRSAIAVTFRSFDRLAMLLVTVPAILALSLPALGLPPIISAVGLAAVLLIAILAVVLIAVATKLGLGLRPIGRILLLATILASPLTLTAFIVATIVLATVILATILLTAILLAPVLAVLAARRLFDLFIGREFVPALAAFLTGLAAIVLAIKALGPEAPIRVAALLLRRLLLSRGDDAVVMLGMLQIALGDNPIAR